jgi:hypothetical protein
MVLMRSANSYVEISTVVLPFVEPQVSRAKPNRSKPRRSIAIKPRGFYW